MFNIVETRRAWWPVTFKGVTEDGAVVDNLIDLQFEILSVDDNLKLHQDAAAMTVDARPDEQPYDGDKSKVGEGKPAAKAASLSETMAKFALRFIRNWKGVGAENGDPLPFSDENLARLFNIPNTFEAALTAYRDCASGAAETRTGN